MNQHAPQRPDWPTGHYTTALIALERQEAFSFESALHLARFGRYLFSTTDRHPTTEATVFNPIGVFHQDGRVASVRHNTDPKAEAKAWTERVRDREDLAQAWTMDLHYAAILYPDPTAKVWYSNWLLGEVREDGGLMIIDEDASKVAQKRFITHDPAQLDYLLSRHLTIGDQVRAWHSAPRPVREAIFRRVLKEIGRLDAQDPERDRQPARCVLAVGHADQESPFHIHRITWRD